MTETSLPRLGVQWAIYLAVMGLLIWAGLRGADQMGYAWQWYNIPRYLIETTDQGLRPGALVWGALTTLWLSALAFGLALVFGLGLALLRLSDLVVGRRLALWVLEINRNIPLLVLLYLFYFVLGPIFGLDRLWASILCLAVFHGALVSEIIRAGINATGRGQWEAAASIGMTRAQAYRHIILPQALRVMLAPLLNEAIHLVKSSAIVGVVGVVELTTVGRNLISETYMSFELWFTVAAIYLALTVALSSAVERLERRLALKGR